MPLRDHYRPPVELRVTWGSFHASWPVFMSLQIVENLPEGYIVEPTSSSGGRLEVDVAAYEQQNWLAAGEDFEIDGGGGTGTAVLTAAVPTLSVETELDDQAEYAVRIYDLKQARKLVATIEIVSPANKDRPEHREAFVTKCAAYIQSGVSVTIIDMVTTRHANLYTQLSEVLHLPPPAKAGADAALYAVAFRGLRRPKRTLKVQAWVQELALGKALPTLPIWLADEVWVPLDLEASYLATSKMYRLPPNFGIDVSTSPN